MTLVLRLLSLSVMGFAVLAANAQVTYTYKPRLNDPWRADSMFVGASMAVRDSTKPVVVRYLGYKVPQHTGSLSIMLPGAEDSAQFLFHNYHPAFPDEDTVVTVGTFSRWAELVFMYRVDTTTNLVIEPLIGKHLYSGQNRRGIDAYVSDVDLQSYVFSPRWFAAGDVDDSTVEVGVDATMNFSFQSVRFEVSNVVLLGHHRHKVPQVRLTPTSSEFADTMTVTWVLPTIEARLLYPLGDYSSFDTVRYTFSLDTNRAVCYATDGATPNRGSPLAPVPLVIDRTTSACFVGYLDGDTAWLPSDPVRGYYERLGAIPSPEATPGSGTFSAEIRLTFSVPGHPGASVYYTVDGSQPDSMVGERYLDTIRLSESATVRAVAYEDGYLRSAPVTFEYVVVATNIATPFPGVITLPGSTRKAYDLAGRSIPGVLVASRAQAVNSGLGRQSGLRLVCGSNGVIERLVVAH